jgi:hypothetical protein
MTMRNDTGNGFTILPVLAVNSMANDKGKMLEASLIPAFCVYLLTLRQPAC